MQAHPCSTHYAPCAHDLARHEAGTAMLGDFPKLNFSEYVEQIMAQVRASLLPELQKTQTMVLLHLVCVRPLPPPSLPTSWWRR